MKQSLTLSIIGMHRSGTSLVARYLHESGLFLGDDLMGKHWSNPAGHFEDNEFVNLHNLILKAHNVDHTLSSPIAWNIDGIFTDRAKTLIEARNVHTQWGWKDPRTTLFLPFWKSLLPDCHFVIVYRHYLPVIRSLISRDILFYRAKTNRLERMIHPRFTQNELIDLFNKYLRTWIWYYNEIIAHVLKDHDVKYSFITYDQFSQGDFSGLKKLSEQGFRLNPPADFNKSPIRARAIKDIPSNGDISLLETADGLDRYFKIVS